jgi:hypothetical protein
MSATLASEGNATTYRIVSRVHVNQWSNELQQAVPGWDVRVYWVKTGYDHSGFRSGQPVHRGEPRHCHSAFRRH